MKFPGKLFLTCGVKINPPEIAAEEGQPAKRPTFEMDAYTGATMDLGGWPHPVVVDLSGLEIGTQKAPIFRDHDSRVIVGHTDKVAIEGGILRASGVFSSSSEAAREVVDLGASGFPWQASLGARVKKVRLLREDAEAEVNGRRVQGPAYIAEKTRLKEISFVALGADESTSATVAASAAGVVDSDSQGEGEIMSEPVVTAASTPAPVGLTLEEVRAEGARIAEVNRLCAGAPEIAAQAIKEGWTAEKAELHALKAEAARRSQDSGVGSPAVIIGSDCGWIRANAGLDAVKAATCLRGGVSETEVEATYGRKAIDASGRFRRMGVRDLAATCCSLDGVPAPKLGAGDADWARAAFSSTSFTNLLDDSAKKTLLAAYNAVPSVARVIAKALTASDFKTHRGIRLTGDILMKKVENGGEITHGTLGEDSFTYAVDTFGRMIGLTRQDLINDDLGAFLQLPQMFGRGAALAVEQAFWTLVLANTGSFFTGGNGNYQEGSGTALGIDSLSSAVQLLEEQTDPDGNPVLIRAKYLVVPPALKAIAQQLYVSTNIIAGTATAKQPAANIHLGAYEPLSTPYLKSAAAAWYLFGDPADVAAFGIAWLNGVQEPVVEEVATPPQYLGRTWRGYIDFGVAQVDKRGAVKSKGTA